MHNFGVVPNLWTIKHTGLYIFKGQVRKCRNEILRLLQLTKLLTNCCMRPCFIYRGENIRFFLSVWCRMFRLPGLRSDLGSQFDYTQCFSRTLLSYIHKNQGYFVYSLCWPRRKQIIIKSTQIDACDTATNQWLSLCLHILHAKETEWPTRTEQNKFPLWRRTHFKFHFEVLMNNHHSVVVQAEKPNSSIKPCTLWQYTNLSSLWNYRRKTLSLEQK